MLHLLFGFTRTLAVVRDFWPPDGHIEHFEEAQKCRGKGCKFCGRLNMEALEAHAKAHLQTSKAFRRFTWNL